VREHQERREKFPGRRIVQRACHHKPEQFRVVLFPPAGDALGKDLKQAFVGYRRYRESSFRAVKTQPGALAAGNREAGHLAGPDEFSSQVRGFGVFSGLGRIGRFKGKIRSRCDGVKRRYARTAVVQPA